MRRRSRSVDVLVVANDFFSMNHEDDQRLMRRMIHDPKPTPLEIPPAENENSLAHPPSLSCTYEECVICLEDLVPGQGEALFTAECSHVFHFTCLLENINHDEANANKCPICRRVQREYPESSSRLANAHPYCTQCGLKGSGSEECTKCHANLVHTPRAQARARAAELQRNNYVVECPTCAVRCLVSIHARGTMQCPEGHLFQVRARELASSLPPPTFSRAPVTRSHLRRTDSVTILRNCPTCQAQVQMPPGAGPGQYMCPQGHIFVYTLGHH